MAVDKGSITPLFCAFCDANAKFYWTGSDYESPGPGDHLQIDSGKPIFERPDGKSKVVLTGGKDTFVEVVSFGPKRRDGKRWYQVKYEPENERAITGYVYRDFALQLGP